MVRCICSGRFSSMHLDLPIESVTSVYSDKYGISIKRFLIVEMNGVCIVRDEVKSFSESSSV